MSETKKRKLKPGYSSLVVTRREGQSFEIGEHILVEAMKVGGKIRFRISAPRHMAMWRTEVDERPTKFQGFETEEL